jgi:tryptophan-rich sensory protein
MAVSFWRILRARPEAGPKGMAIGVFLAQLGLNVAWSWAFFGQRSPLMGLVVIGLLLLAIALNIRVFAKIDRAAGWALYPYLAWVGFATLLNAAIVFLNR